MPAQWQLPTYGNRSDIGGPFFTALHARDLITTNAAIGCGIAELHSRAARAAD
jgi:hypothetical protein